MAKDALLLIGNPKAEQTNLEEQLVEEKAARVQEIKAKDWENVDLRHQQEKDKKEIADLRADLSEAHDKRRESANRVRKEIEDLEESVASYKAKWVEEKAALTKTEQKRDDEQKANISLNGHLRIKETNLTNLKGELEQEKKEHAAELDRLKEHYREQIQRGNGRYNEKIKELQRVKDELDGAIQANRNVRQAEDNAARYLSAQKEALAKSSALEKDLEKIRKEFADVQAKLKSAQKSSDAETLLKAAQQEAQDAQVQLQNAKNKIANLEDELADKEAEAEERDQKAEKLSELVAELGESPGRMRRKRQKSSEAGGDDEREVKRSRSERP